MKRLAFLRTFVVLLLLTGAAFNGTAKPADPAVTFYKTPLVCNAAQTIGCGSRAKPVLLAMEKNSAVKFTLENKLITQDEAVKIKTDAEAYFKKELVKIRTNQQLNDDSQTKFKAAMYNIAEKYIGKARAQKAMLLYQQNCEKQCKKDAACTSPGVAKDCCSKEKTI